MPIADKLRQLRGGAKPQFVIEHNGRLFVTRSLVEIDPSDRALGRSQRRRLGEVRDRLRHEESSARAARYHPGSGSSAAEKLLSGTVETRSTISDIDDGGNFAATNPPSQ